MGKPRPRIDQRRTSWVTSERKERHRDHGAYKPQTNVGRLSGRSTRQPPDIAPRSAAPDRPHATDSRRCPSIPIRITADAHPHAILVALHRPASNVDHSNAPIRTRCGSLTTPVRDTDQCQHGSLPTPIRTQWSLGNTAVRSAMPAATPARDGAGPPLFGPLILAATARRRGLRDVASGVSPGDVSGWPTDGPLMAPVADIAGKHRSAGEARGGSMAHVA
jgi:hypothetical protein